MFSFRFLLILTLTTIIGMETTSDQRSLCLKLYKHRPPRLSEDKSSFNTPNEPWIEIKNAQMWADGKAIDFDSIKGNYVLPNIISSTVYIEIEAPEIARFTQSIPVSAFTQDCLPLYLQSKDDLIIVQREQKEMFLDPRSWQIDADSLETNTFSRPEEFMEAKGALGGVCSYCAENQIKAFAEKHHLRWLSGGKGKYFFLLPAKANRKV